ncbi:hypothetical protein DM806_06705 [Sphingobium lactosutens]|uniref:hypothetical protein n=1 Tax=Sphingobium lactosutens TaxID=522773 RepID=UPI0015BC18AD|nr:hypothetical protein [Sphingobium lactosutens]NWK95359.1 hypothetical protein [Sphingobium lactosutens]
MSRLFPIARIMMPMTIMLATPAAAQEAPDFFGAALCQPPYSTGSATALYEAAETIAKADTSTLGAAIYPLPKPIERDGFVAKAVLFAGMSVGVLLEGEVAAEAAKRYGLSAEKSHLLGASSLGFARQLDDAEQGMQEMGLISIVARQGPAMAGRTLLACEFVSHEDRQALESLEDDAP